MVASPDVHSRPSRRMSTPRTVNTPPTTWNTKIVCTLGPASSSDQQLEQMIQAGMDMCRLNFSHGDYASHKETFERVRRLSATYNHQVGILCDIQGPKIRTGRMVEPFNLNVGDVVHVTSEEILGTKERFQIKYDSLIEDLDKEDVIFINDGIVKLVVFDKDSGSLICKCAASGKVSDHKGCNLPSGNLSVNVVTPKDAEDLEFIAHLDPEYVASSFIGTGDDVRQVRARLAECGNTHVKIIAKVERPVALENLDDIIRESDAVMVARGDLGVEIDAWDVPKWQKEIIRLCNKESKPVIVATQMLESMCENSRPTRAEASDVYNAVLDGADAVMLSGESSVGKYPVQAVNIMDQIVSVAQEHLPKRDPKDYDSSVQRVTETMAHAAYTIGDEFKAVNYEGKIIVITRSGKAARLISKYRPALPILAFSESLRTVRELTLVWGVRSHFVPEILGLSLEDRVVKAIDTAIGVNYLSPRDAKVCVLTASAFAADGGYLVGVYDIGKLQSLGLVRSA